ncbi:polysaccharide deacetylase family protein [Fodinicola acaciae]|uniref:polysaccharide deacetylase family protein n=1 Tax=Fodinicola acaciae TaxID=2681555 RepID=UPI0013D45A0E|nr:polysaccharide deacetylase family protein [Fodinicola acaciae]
MTPKTRFLRRSGVAGLAILALLLVGCGNSSTPQATNPVAVAPTASTPKPPPQAPNGVRHLQPAATVYEENGTPGVTLTFDDGPDPQWTPKVLAVLREYHVHAVFCEIGFRVRQHPELTRQIVKEGHTLCNHTMWHKPELGKQPAATITKDLSQTNLIITKASGGVRPYYFRAPHGDFTPREVQVAAGLGLASLGWRVTSSDWQKPLMQPANMANWVGRTMQPGCIILFHDGGSPGTHWHTVAGLRLILDDIINKRHWQVTTL